MEPHPESYDSTQHTGGEGYSDKSKIPTISGLLEKHKRQGAPKEPTSTEEMSEGAKEKQEAMDKANAGKEKPAKAFQTKGEREVLDPITQMPVVIKDAELKDYQDEKLFSRAALDPADNSEGGPATNLPSGQGLDDQASVKRTAPHPVQPSNILLQQFPPPIEEDTVGAIAKSLATTSYATIAALGAVWFFVAFRAGVFAFLFRSTLIGAIAFGVYAANGIAGRKIEKELDRVRLNLLKQRADKLSTQTSAATERFEQFSPPTPESAEWLNAFTTTIWPLINPSMFQSVVDMIEDVMQASLPGFIDAVKVDDFTIGKNALHLVSMRALPDQPHHKDYPKEEWIDQGDKEHALDPKLMSEEQKQKKVQSEGADADMDQSGDYVNFELSFAYFAPPGVKKLQGQNISLIIQFFLGMFWIAVETIVGTVRLRIQIVPDPPFIRNVTFTLMGVPKIEASAIPMSKALPNVLDLPLISGFVQSSIAAACSVYCAPQSMTINVGQILSGDGVKKDTKALGILAITIHYAEDLSAQDDNGFSDPYVVLAYAKFGKPLFSTRIIKHDLNPVWEQTAYLLVSDDEIRAKEDLSIQLWDSDAMTADDLVGRIKVPLVDLMLEPNKVFERKDKLMGFEDADAMSGTLSWSVAYFDKAPLNPALKKDPGVDHSLPKELQDRPELKVETAAIDTAEEADVRRTPPDPRYNSGIFSIVIHQINSLETQNLTGASGKDREGKAGQDTDDPGEETSNLPSAYCEVVVNDDLVYKTRTKQYSAMPFYEAGTEIFLRNYKETSVRVVVRDARLREHDPILGIVNLDLIDLFSSASEVTRLFALQDGVGFGRISLSLLFKGVQIELPKNLSGWDTGTVCITSAIKVEPVPGSDFDFKEKKMFISTLEAKQKVAGSEAAMGADGVLEYKIDEHIRLPTYDRYASAVYFDHGGGFTFGPLGNKYDAFAALWLKDLVDDESTEIRIPIVIAEESGGSLRANYLSDQTAKTHKYTTVGWLVTTVHLDSGLDEDHEQYATTQTQRHEFETYDRIEGQAASAEKNSHANDDGNIDKEEQRAIDKAHKKALESRHRGVMQYRPIRTLKWAKDGGKDRMSNFKDKIMGRSKKEETVATEAN
ncbi:hypothetical protein RQP46_004643 [Phenoliferia psychrophenolica]